MTQPTLQNIRQAADELAKANRALMLLAKAQEAEIADAVAPITAKYRANIDVAAEDKALAMSALQALVDASPNLFVRPRSMTVDGVKAGYRKEEDTLDWDDEKAVISRIKSLLPEQADLLVRSEETLVIDALVQLDAKTQRQIGLRRVSGADKSFVTIGESDIDKFVKVILADAARRQGEDEKPAKKGKAKVKETA